MRQRRWIELIVYYDCIINYHPGKENIAAGALSRKFSSLVSHLKVLYSLYLTDLRSSGVDRAVAFHL